MAYIVTPNTFQGGDIISAPMFNQNYAAITGALTDGTKELNVSTMTASTVSCTGDATVSGDLFVSGPFYGARSVVYLVSDWHYDSSGSGYRPLWGYNSSSVNQLGPVMPKSGSIVGYGLAMNTMFMNDIGYDILVSNVTAFSIPTTAPTTSIASTFARGVYEFSAGDRISAYEHVTTGLGSGNVDLYIEVQYNS